jgi:TatD DNase family protein
MDIVDTHAHLSEFQDEEGVTGRAKKAGITAIVAVGANHEANEKTLLWAERNPRYVNPAIGIHPTEWAGDDVPTSLDFIRERIDGCVAVGEIGLDYWYRDARKNEDIRDKQRSIYVEQLRIAKEWEKPASIHGRGAWREVLDLAIAHGPETIVFHWYSGPMEVLSELLDRGYYISATPAAEYSKDHRAALEETPLERIVIETDSPVYMRNRKRNSEPADTVVTLQALSRLKEISEEKVSRITTGNARKIFKL